MIQIVIYQKKNINKIEIGNTNWHMVYQQIFVENIERLNIKVKNNEIEDFLRNAVKNISNLLNNLVETMKPMIKLHKSIENPNKDKNIDEIKFYEEIKKNTFESLTAERRFKPLIELYTLRFNEFFDEVKSLYITKKKNEMVIYLIIIFFFI